MHSAGRQIGGAGATKREFVQQIGQIGGAGATKREFGQRAGLLVSLFRVAIRHLSSLHLMVKGKGYVARWEGSNSMERKEGMMTTTLLHEHSVFDGCALCDSNLNL